MRKRFQKGSLRKVDRSWIVQWREDGHRRKRTLGLVSQMTKTQAQGELATILSPINDREKLTSKSSFGDFVRDSYLPFYRRKWKASTAITNEDRISNHLVSGLEHQSVESVSREGLQALLDGKAADGLSFSMVNHMRWDLRQIFEMAVAEGLLKRNPAKLLFTPKEAQREIGRTMTSEEARRVLGALDLRERLVVGLALVAGMRPGEIFGLLWGRLSDEYAEVRQRVYKGEVGTPKTVNSIRKVALSDRLLADIGEWRKQSIDTRPQAWVFPSENLRTPLSKENCWRRYIGPRLRRMGLGWVNFQVMRRTHSSLMSDLKIEPKVVADQLGHTLDVNLNTYTQTSIERRKQAVDAFECALRVM
ncbi:MAG TPA: tyrosine-type recombinase/integrase [Blastocatellia bacterium]|nr:tyrosine-type recombinase/integrase [Blastocatellia bacterium]